MRYPWEVVADLRKKLGREPTDDEIKASRDDEIRKRYADMAISAATVPDPEDEVTPPAPTAPGPAVPGSTGFIDPPGSYASLQEWLEWRAELETLDWPEADHYRRDADDVIARLQQEQDADK